MIFVVNKIRFVAESVFVPFIGSSYLAHVPLDDSLLAIHGYVVKEAIELRIPYFQLAPLLPEHITHNAIPVSEHAYQCALARIVTSGF